MAAAVLHASSIWEVPPKWHEATSRNFGKWKGGKEIEREINGKCFASGRKNSPASTQQRSLRASGPSRLNTPRRGQSGIAPWLQTM